MNSTCVTDAQRSWLLPLPWSRRWTDSNSFRHKRSWPQQRVFSWGKCLLLIVSICWRRFPIFTRLSSERCAEQRQDLIWGRRVLSSHTKTWRRSLRLRRGSRDSTRWSRDRSWLSSYWLIQSTSWRTLKKINSSSSRSILCSIEYCSQHAQQVTIDLQQPFVDIWLSMSSLRSNNSRRNLVRRWREQLDTERGQLNWETSWDQALQMIN